MTSHKGTTPSAPFSNRARCDFQGVWEECPACFPEVYAEHRALHRHYFAGFTLNLRPNDTYLGRVISPHHHVDADHYPLGYAVGTSSEEVFANLADMYPENNYFVLPEAVIA
jgi:hypothetical protein